MKERIQRFMNGRYGVDSFSKFLNVVSVVLFIISLFSRWMSVYFVAVLILGYAYVRMFSRNHAKRYAENRKYLDATSGLRRFINRQKTYLKTLRTHHIYRCPSCRQKIRIPRGKGRIAVRCPKCSTEFIKKS